MKINLLKVTRSVSLTASCIVTIFAACDEPVTSQLPDDFGEFRVIYELAIDVIPRPDLADVSDDNEMYIINGYVEGPETVFSLWYVEPPDAPVMLASGTDNWYGFPVVSPDNRYIAYEDPGALYVIPVAGGSPFLIFDYEVTAQPFQWLDNETVMFSSMEGDGWYLRKVNIDTLEVSTIIDFGPEVGSVWRAYMSPDREYLGVSGAMPFRLYDMVTGEYRTFDFGQSYCNKWSPDGTMMLHGDKYFDPATGKRTVYFRNNKLDLSYTYASWTPDSKKVILGQKHYYNIYEYEAFRIYEVTVNE